MALSGFGPFSTTGACTNQGSFSITLPAGTPAGLLLVTGKHQIHVEHTSGTLDRGYLAWSPTAGSCPTQDYFRSYFKVIAGEPTATGAPPNGYEITVFTQSAFSVPAGGGTFTVYLVGQMLNGASANDADGNDLVNIEFHTQ